MLGSVVGDLYLDSISVLKLISGKLVLKLVEVLLLESELEMDLERLLKSVLSEISYIPVAAVLNSSSRIDG